MLTDDIDQVLRQHYHRPRSTEPSDAEAGPVGRALAALEVGAPESFEVLTRIYKEQRSLRWLESRGYGDRRRGSVRSRHLPAQVSR